MYYAYHLLHSCNFGLENKILERLANSLIGGVRERVIIFLIIKS